MTNLYRHFDANGALLYIGVSLNALKRLSQHQNLSPWFASISNVTIETFETKQEALLAERHAIERENPKFNIERLGARRLLESPALAKGEAMSPNQYRNAIDSMGLTQGDAAIFLGVSIRTSHGYANGDPIPEAVSKLLRLMLKLGLKPEDL